MKKNPPEQSTNEIVELFLAKAIKVALIKPRDAIYLRNVIYHIFSLQYTYPFDAIDQEQVQKQSLAQLVEQLYLSLNGSQIDRLGENKDQITTAIINLILPSPSVIEDKFNLLKQQQGIKSALDWYYEFSKITDYIKTEDIAKNQSWSSQTNFGQLEITINLSKPEKDPLEIARLKLVKPKVSSYPKCLLCVENEGFAGSVSQPARQNHRILEIELNNKPWFFQYSPYSYYPEHSIIINPVHCDMLINAATFDNFFDFVNQVPHYLIGSNTDIPIVGGSILTHDHYQAGNHTFPIEKALIKDTYKLEQYKSVEINHLNWPVTTLQLIGTRDELTVLIERIMDRWYSYNNIELDIIAQDNNGTRHNAITPIMRKLGEDKYAVYLLLRNNRTTKQHPEGIFHPHKHLHHIKKENIGLIEAMGLAILPGRLLKELAELEKLLLLNDKKLALSEILFDDSLIKHESWLAELYHKYGSFNSSNIKELIKNTVATKFSQVLECAGVIKNNPSGDMAMKEFINLL